MGHKRTLIGPDNLVTQAATLELADQRGGSLRTPLGVNAPDVRLSPNSGAKAAIEVIILRHS
jgi:hypothetical protein